MKEAFNNCIVKQELDDSLIHLFIPKDIHAVKLNTAQKKFKDWLDQNPAVYKKLEECEQNLKEEKQKKKVQVLLAYVSGEPKKTIAERFGGITSRNICDWKNGLMKEREKWLENLKKEEVNFKDWLGENSEVFEELKKHKQQFTSEYKKRKVGVLLACAEGQSSEKIQKDYNVQPQTIRDWKNALKKKQIGWLKRLEERDETPEQMDFRVWLKLHPEKEKELEEFTKDPCLHVQEIANFLLRRKYESLKETAEGSGFTERCIQKWQKKYKQEGLLFFERRKKYKIQEKN